MSFILTLVASSAPLTAGHVAAFIDHPLVQACGPVGVPGWLAVHKAVDIPILNRPDTAQVKELQTYLVADSIDIFITEKSTRRKKLLLADMDATIVTTETLDELAVYAGLKDEIAAITARAMRGELDFQTALTERVGMLKGLSQDKLQETLDETQLTAGADILVKTMAHHGATCVMISGGFTFFTEAIAQRAGFHHHHGNILGITDGQLTGVVEGELVDKSVKERKLRDYMQELGLMIVQTMAIGDGANDLPMLQAAGLGVGFQPKPVLREALDNCILYGDLTAALYMQGYNEGEFVS